MGHLDVCVEEHCPTRTGPIHQHERNTRRSIPVQKDCTHTVVQTQMFEDILGIFFAKQAPHHYAPSSPSTQSGTFQY